MSIHYLKRKNEMDYKIDCRQWGRFFSVPCSVVDDYVLLSDGDFVKVLLCILCSNSQLVSPEQLGAKAGVSPEKAEDAIIHWAGLGVVSAETALIEARIRDINTKIDMVGAVQRNMAGNYAGKVQGIMIGLAFTLIIGVLFLI